MYSKLTTSIRFASRLMRCKALSLYVALLALLPLLGSTFSAGAAPPNIVVFISDDHTLRDSSVYGSKDMQTPHMDQLAAAGLSFDLAFAPSPSCAPSRGAILTGLMPARNGAEPNHAQPRADIKKLPAYLKELGYEVVAFGKVGHYNQTADYGFDLVKHTNYHEDIAVPAALEWLRYRQSTKPLALFVGCNWPHVPWPQTPEGHKPEALTVPANHVDTPVTRRFRGKYYAAIGRMDADLGLIYTAAQDKFGTNLFFLHFSDQGAQWPFGKWCLYDDGIRTPMIAVWPGHIAPGTRTSAMVSLVDVLPTLINVAGGQAPEDLDGHSFAKVLLGQASRFRDYIFSTHSGDGKMNVYPSRCVRDERWKYILNLHPEFKFTSHVTEVAGEDGNYWKSWVQKAENNPEAATIVQRYQARPREELYDLSNDPLEQHNLAETAEVRDVLKKLRGLLENWMKEQGDKGKIYGEPTLLRDSTSKKATGAKKPEQEATEHD
jgi:N-sulfoglucosamine sulfohydrolase